MDYDKQVAEIAMYFKNNEKDRRDFKIGIEFEHFVIDKESLRAISYYGKDGVEESLKELEANGWIGEYEGNYLLGLKKGNKVITLEPGSQLEFSSSPQKNIVAIEREYIEFLREIVAILEDKNQGLIAVGYQPETRIEDIRMLPKRRYGYMFEYFKSKGSHAHNMMKGTASVQASFDFKSEKDYIRKFRVGNALSPLMYALFDNAFYYEGGIWESHNLRSYIWDNCDKDRSGIVDGTFDDDFGYERYAKYILNGPPIFMYDGKSMYSTGDKLFKEVFDVEDYSVEELEHGLTMFFPDVRTKKYIEMRMMDAIPYPLNLACIALWKGILYDEGNLSQVYEYIGGLRIGDIDRAKASILKKGLRGRLGDDSILEIARWIIGLAKDGLDQEEIRYILPLEEMVDNEKNPYQITKDRDYLGKREALKWCILNNLEGVK